jgi:hypothetical protein
MHGVPQQNNTRLELGIQHYYARTSCTNLVLKKSMCSSIKMLGEKRPYHDICVQDGEASAEERSPPHNGNPPPPSRATTPQDAGGEGREAAEASPHDAGGGDGSAAGAADGGWGDGSAAEASPHDAGGGDGSAAGASPQKRSRWLETCSTVYSAVGSFVVKRRDWIATEYEDFKTFRDDSARLAAMQAPYTRLHERMDDSLADFRDWGAGVGDTASALASTLDALSPVRTTVPAVVRHCPSCIALPPVILHAADGCTHDKQGRPSCYSCQTCSKRWNVCKTCDQLKRFSTACPKCPSKK